MLVCSPRNLNTMDRPEAPLISNQADHDDAGSVPSPAAAKPSSKPSVFVLLLTFAAGISGLLFGCRPPTQTLSSCQSS